MINRFYKIINNRISIFLKSLFFLRYLFAIFFISTILFLFIPNFFDYGKKDDAIKTSLLKSYGLQLIDKGKIRYSFFPIPHLEIENTISKFQNNKIQLNSKKIKIYPKIKNIYSYKKFEINKIKLLDSELIIDQKYFNNFLKNIFTLEKKYLFEDLFIKILDNENPVIEFNEVKYTNYGIKKDLITGIILGREFKIDVRNNKKINLKLPHTGISAVWTLQEMTNSFVKKGNFKGKILKSNLNLDFSYDIESLKIENLFLRSKNISLNSDGIIKLKPYFQSNFNSNIKDIDFNLFKNLDINKILKFKAFIKKFNSENYFVFEKKKFQKSLVDNLKINTNLSYGRLIITKNFSISDNLFNCTGIINLLEQFPILNFSCRFVIQDLKKIYKKIDLDHKINKNSFNLIVDGRLNILNKKINFNSIHVDESFEFLNEDLIYFKNAFENIIFDKEFFSIFNLTKIKKFILEIS